MAKQGNKKTQAQSTSEWWLNINVDLNTLKAGPFDSFDDAQAEAERMMKVGAWGEKRLYPPHAIVYIEAIEKTL